MGAMTPGGRTRVSESLHSRGNVFYLFQEVDIRLVRDPSPLYRLSQIIRSGELLGFSEIIPLEQTDEFVNRLKLRIAIALSGRTARCAGRVAAIARRSRHRALNKGYSLLVPKASCNTAAVIEYG